MRWLINPASFTTIYSTPDYICYEGATCFRQCLVNELSGCNPSDFFCPIGYCDFHCSILP